MKIKILKNKDLDKLENDVNEFIKDKCVIDIKYESTQYRTCKYIENILIVIILYDSYGNCGYLNTKSLMDFKKV
ncbi:hypothetical protein [Clostridium butyricum]|uniref:hypothetical protein n=1 Tax=Clostridium butyricum TaxID=1492 RepID=UPI00168B9237|nr:hypothetical protein [Clostridium butyricum]MDB2153431.1 hypothetical protein [Clostridium butyricum]